MQNRNLYLNGTFAKGVTLAGVVMSIHHDHELTDLCSTKEEIKDYVEKYRNLILQEGTATFFLFEIAGTFFIFMAHRILLDGGVVEVDFHVFDLTTHETAYNSVEIRVVSPFYVIPVNQTK